MTAQVLFEMPTRFCAGETVSFRRQLEDYPASLWTLKGFLKGKSTLEFTADADEDDHVIEIPSGVADPPAAGSRDLVAGWYRYFEQVTDGTKTVTIVRGTMVQVLPDPSQAGAGDLQLFAEKIVDVLEAALAGTLTRDQARFVIDGVEVEFIPLAERERLLTKYRGILRQQTRGKRFGRAVKFTFGGRIR